MRRYTALKRVLIREKKGKEKETVKKKGFEEKEKKREVKDGYCVMGRNPKRKKKKAECETEEP